MTYLLWKPGSNKGHLKCVTVRVKRVKRVRGYGTQHGVDPTGELVANCRSGWNRIRTDQSQYVHYNSLLLRALTQSGQFECVCCIDYVHVCLQFKLSSTDVEIMVKDCKLEGGLHLIGPLFKNGTCKKGLGLN